MSLLFHPKTLELLASFKVTGKVELLDKVLPLIIDNAYHIDISLLNSIVLSHSCVQETLEDTVQRLFVKVILGDKLVCICRRVQDCEYSDLVLENRKYAPCSLGNPSSSNFVASLEIPPDLLILPDCPKHTDDECSDMCFHDTELQMHLSELIADDVGQFVGKSSCMTACTQSEAAKRKIRKTFTQSNTLNFAKTSMERSNTEKFSPLDFRNMTFVYNRNHIVLDTQRKRNDLVNPVPLQFIKHFDQIRPPIYQKRGELVRVVFSYRRLPQIISYDEDSSDQWEVVEESFSDALTEESTEEVPEDEHWVERDSEEIEVARFNKRPTFSFRPVTIETYFDPSKYLNAPLLESDIFPSSLEQDLAEFRKTSPDMDENQMAVSFSSLYLVSISAVLEQLGHSV